MFQHFCLSVAAATFATAADPPKPGEVTVSIAAVDWTQPAGWPVVVEIKLTNVGTEPISWWSGGPDKYPGAEHFAVQVRYLVSDGKWHDVEATNGQATEGSGTHRQLKPGESVVVPLAVPVEKADHVTVLVRPKRWQAAAAAEAAVNISDAPRVLDPYRARVIAEVIQQPPPFRQHLAERYADAVVIDALTKLVTVDNTPIVTRAAAVLARHPSIPTTSGDALAGAVRRWLPRPRVGWQYPHWHVVVAALRTQAEPARTAVLEALQNPPDGFARGIVIDTLRVSPGDDAWLRRARAAIVAAQQARPDDAELARQAKHATDWLDARLKSPRQ